MELTQEHANFIAAMDGADNRPRPKSPGCPAGRSMWHTARRLVVEEDLAASEDWADKLGGQLQRRGLVTHRTQFGVTRWALTEAGRAQAARLAGAGA